MYKPSTYLVIYLFSYPSTCVWDLFPTELVMGWNQILTQFEVHPQLSNYRHPVDGVLVGASSLWPTWVIYPVHNGCALLLGPSWPATTKLTLWQRECILLVFFLHPEAPPIQILLALLLLLWILLTCVLSTLLFWEGK